YVVHIPFLVAVKERYPNAILVGISKNSGADFLVEAGFINELEVIDGFSTASLKIKYNFDIGFNLRPSSVGTSLQMLKLRIPYRIGFKKFGAFYTHSVPLDVTTYRADLFLSLLGISSTLDIVPCLKKHIESDGTLKNKIVLAPGAGGEEKKWSLANYIQLARKIAELRSEEIVFLTGPKEEEEKNILEQEGFAVIHSPDVTTLFRLVNSCKLFVSNDCGPSHVAHIMGVNQVVVFKEYLPEWFLERDNSGYVSSQADLSSITPDELINCASKILACEVGAEK
ncbi:MAG: glycosyltransferase family 9 protein, partial [Vreelandella alkaliphila]